MSRLIFSALSFLTCFAVSVTSSATNEPVRVGATFAKIYVPGGFDSNDNVQIVGEGMFRNTCYRPAPSTVTVDPATSTINVGPVAYEYSGFCLQVILPFQRVLDLGILKPGTWRVLQGHGVNLQQLGEVSIRPALTEQADDFLYAPVDQAFYQENGLASVVYLTGQFRLSCMKMDTVKTTVEKDVLVIQPIAKIIAGPCNEGTFAFNQKVDLGFVPKGRYLLHVRSANGNSVNSLVSVN